MKRNQPRFFVGIYEIGHLTLYLSKGLRALGFQVTNVVREIESPIREREISHDKYIGLGKNRFARGFNIFSEFMKHFPTHDVFVLNRTESFISYLRKSSSNWLRRFSYFDLRMLKQFGKKIVMIASGSDIRSDKLLIKEMEDVGLHQHAKYINSVLVKDATISDEKKQKHISAIEKYVDHIFTRPIHAQLLSMDFHLLWLPIDLNAFVFGFQEDDIPLIVHAPSNPRIKGTKYVLDAIDKLRDRGYKFQFELCQNMSNIDVRRKLTQSSIAVDQLILPGYGLFAIEALASGNAVLGSSVPGYNGFSHDLPIITTTPDTIYRNLERLINETGTRMDLAYKGREYVEKYHEYKTVAKNFLESIGEHTNLT